MQSKNNSNLFFSEGNRFGIEFENGTVYGEKALACFTKFVETNFENVRSYLHPICLGISCIALAFMVAFHLWIPKLRDLQGLLLTSHALSLLMADVLLTVSITLSTYLNSYVCILVGKFL